MHISYVSQKHSGTLVHNNCCNSNPDTYTIIVRHD